MDLIERLAFSRVHPSARPLVEGLIVAIENQQQRGTCAPQQRSNAIPALLTMRMIREHYLPIDERTLDRWIAAGRFPKADKSLGHKTRLWRRQTVEAWCEQNSRSKR